MNIKWFVRLFPYFIVEKICVGVNPDHAMLRFSETIQYSVDVYEVEAGVWIVKSSKVELLQSRAKLKSLIMQIDERLEDYD